ncbi:Cucumber peeling cupredoxin [Bienertia sinuspersici]
MAKMLAVAAVIIMLMNCISAEIYTVGDKDGWIKPTSPNFYSSWAAKHNFVVGDILVARVEDEEAYEECEEENAEIFEKTTEITLAKPGSYFFICTVGNHCDSGQKLQINVTSAMPPVMSPEESPSDVGSSPPMPLASTFLGVTTFMASIIALLY